MLHCKDCPGSFHVLQTIAGNPLLLAVTNKLLGHTAWCAAAGFGGLRSLVKLQASYNPFETLPDDLWQLPALELFRLAVGQLKHWPARLGEASIVPCVFVCEESFHCCSAVPL